MYPMRTLLLFVLIAILLTDKIMHAVTIDPASPIGPTIVRGGWDIKAWPTRLNSIGEAQDLYGNVNANILRIPMFATAHDSDGSVDTSAYSTEIAAIQSVLSVNPDVEVFASLKLQGANTFPAWVSEGSAQWPVENGKIFGNTVQRPNPEHYSTMIADYVSYLKSHGITVDYFGLNNETEGALPTNRYIATYDLLPSQFAARGLTAQDVDFQYVGPDTFGLPSAKSFVNNLSSAGRLDTIDVVSSHYYPQHGSGHESDWGDLSVAAGKPLWHTEVHMPGNSAALADISQTVRDSLSVLFASFRNGVDSFVWWDSGDDTDELRDLMKREVINTTVGAQPVFTTPSYDGKGDPDDEPLYQAFVEGNSGYLWVVNPGSTLFNLPIELASGQFLGGANDIEATFYSAIDNEIVPAEIFSLPVALHTDNQGFNINVFPSQSIAVISFELVDAGDFDGDGKVDGLDFLAWQRDPNLGNLADWQANYSLPLNSQVAAVPEPETFLLLTVVLVAHVSCRRTISCGKSREVR